MSYFPCKNWSDCVPPAEGVAVRNFSAEAPDRPSFFGFYQCAIEGVNPPYSTCTSIVSQEQADFCSARCYPDGIFVNAAITVSGPCGASYSIPSGLLLGPSQQAADQVAAAYAQAAANKLCSGSNSAQFCQVTCADSSMQSHTVDAGLISAATTAQANQLAQELACVIASLKCFGTLALNEPQTCEVQCPTNGGSVSYTIAAGAVHDLSVAAANARALELACLLALLSCPELPALVGSDAQTCSQQCLNQTVTYTIPANAFFAVDKASANALALIFACLALSRACQEENLPPTSFSAGNSVQCATIICP